MKTMTQHSTSMQRLGDTRDAAVITDNKGDDSDSFYHKRTSGTAQATTFTLLVQVLHERLSGADQVHPGFSR